MSELDEIQRELDLELPEEGEETNRVYAGLLFVETSRIGTKATVGSSSSALGRFFVTAWAVLLADQVLGTSAREALDTVTQGQRVDIETTIRTTQNDCMIEGQEIPGKGSKDPKKEVIDVWNNAGSGALGFAKRLDTIRVNRRAAITGQSNFGSNLLVMLYIRVMIALINCIELLLEPSIICNDPNKQKCLRRERYPAMVKECIRKDSTG